MNLFIFKKTIGIAIILHALVFLAIFLGAFGPFAEVGGDFCEAAREGLIKQPANTFSNLAFALFGLLAAFQLSKNKFSASNAITTSPFVAVFFTALMVALSPGSMAMHATEAYMGGYFDMLSMYLIAAFIFTYALERLLLLNKTQFTGVFITVLAICHVFHFLPYPFPFVKFGGNFIFGLFLLLSFFFELYNHYKNKTEVSVLWGYAGVFVFLLSFMIWFTGRDAHPWCHPYSFIQAHAIWHILDALALYLVFRFYASEEDKRFKKQNDPLSS